MILHNSKELTIEEITPDLLSVKFDDTLTDFSSLTTVRDEYVRVLRELSNTHMLNVLFSGGLDSEIVMEACRVGNIKHMTSIMSLSIDGTRMNSHDIGRAIDYCTKYNIDYDIYDLDVLKFFETHEYVKYSTGYKCISPQLCCHLWLLDQVPGFPIMGGDPLRLHLTHLDTPELLYRRYRYFCYEYYFSRTGKAGISSMWSHNLRIIVQVLEQELALAKDGLIRSSFETGMEAYIWKTHLVRLCGFDATAKNDKYTGFEQIRNWYNDKYYCDGNDVFDSKFRHSIDSAANAPYVVHSYPGSMTKFLEKYKTIIDYR